MFDKKITFTVYGEAVSRKSKLAVNKYSNKPYIYTSESTRQWEDSVAGQCLKHRPEQLMKGAVKLNAKFYRNIPKSMSKKDRELVLQEKKRPTTKPDTDNLLKSLADVMRGIFYIDDAQLVETFISKHYSDTPRVEVELYFDE